MRDVSIGSSGATLAGSLWMPAHASKCCVVMVGGSGPSDRNNDVFFPPVREHLIDRGSAVLSYDKRGVGGSTGSWVAASIDDFAADALAAYEFCRATGLNNVGFFGHSEGGWVVLRAADRCAELAFVVTNSTPGMTPAVQDRYAVEFAMRAAGEPDEAITSALALYDDLVERARADVPFEVVAARLRSQPKLTAYFGDPTEDDWRSIGPKLDHDPYRDIAGLTCPQLALFGALDPLVPVPPSVEITTRAAAERANPRATLTIAVFPGADHRMATSADALAQGYLETITSWLDTVMDAS
ncbi:MAG: alpha/beta hydrolase family protein [Actinomycetes bacterium]